ncbi:Permease of the drug/metabolite transporter (DMT) superfamily [Loktanella fryxellensis]|uniref:Permease of the drug/metabolite transporter (DMT) superfamily n=1 Tax=Loktanella fryxellensis TaxID=245187 RepID=A0A1H8IB27_9RHOB|nr:DMT family transporter [Loktanella fryxellensis]SEN65963.1 Permease of the drug/metabolite transporter (DMT) superfamily [Loktanella fryxellensis]
MTATLRACLWMIGAVLSFTAMAIAGRQVSTVHDTFEIMTYRSLLGIGIVFAAARIAGTWHEINGQQLGLHGLRNVAHFTGQNLWFYAIAVLPLAQVFALEFTTPIWVLLLAPLLLGERLTRIGLIAALIGFAGVLVVTRPGSTPLSPGVVAAALCAVGFAISALLTRRLTRTQSVTCILFHLCVMQTAFGLICGLIDGQMAWPNLATLPWLTVIGVAGLFAHFCLTTALGLAPASTVMPVDYIRLPAAALVGALLYGEAIDPFILLGAVLIIAGNMLNLTQRQASPTAAPVPLGKRDTDQSPASH